MIEGDVWNEEELKMHFLSAILDYANFNVPEKIKLFYERPLTGVVTEIPLSVICDALLASPLGINTPKTSYFFLQEFKKGKNLPKMQRGSNVSSHAKHTVTCKTHDNFNDI